MRLRRPQFTPVHSGPHRRIRLFGKWRFVELLIMLVLALFVYWAFRQHVFF